MLGSAAFGGSMIQKFNKSISGFFFFFPCCTLPPSFWFSAFLALVCILFQHLQYYWVSS